MSNLFNIEKKKSLRVKTDGQINSNKNNFKESNRDKDNERTNTKSSVDLSTAADVVNPSSDTVRIDPRDPNALVDLMHANIVGRYYRHAEKGHWYRIAGHPKLLIPISDKDLENEFWDFFEGQCRGLGKKINKGLFYDTIETLGRKNTILPWSGG